MSIETRTTCVARARRTCYECGCVIKPDEWYENLQAKWAGTVSTCPDCLALRETLCKVPYFSWHYGTVIEDADDCFKNGVFKPGQRFAALRTWAEHRVQKYHALEWPISA